MDDFLSRFAEGGATRPDAITGMNPQFRNGLTNLFMSAPPEVQSQLHLFSGYRSPEVQATLYQNALKKYGSPEIARKWVAPPGRSKHNMGVASDLQFGNDAARQWAHENASKFGLAFPLSNEAWHVELAGARGQAPGPAPGPAPTTQPNSLASLYAQPPAVGVPVQPKQAIVPPVDNSLGGLAAMFLQNQAARRKQREDEQQAEDTRRAALLGVMRPFS